MARWEPIKPGDKNSLGWIWANVGNGSAKITYAGTDTPAEFTQTEYHTRAASADWSQPRQTKAAAKVGNEHD